MTPGSGAPPGHPAAAALEQAATLSLCQIVPPPTPSSAAATAVAWAGRLSRLGLALPLFLVHDLGWLFALGADDVRLRSVATPGLPEVLRGRYLAVLEVLRGCPAVAAAPGLRLRDDLVAAVLARLFGELARRHARLGPPIPAVDAAAVPMGPPSGPAATVPGWSLAFLDFLTRPPQAPHLTTAAELLDVDLLRLLASGGGDGRGGAQATSGGLDGAGLLGLVDLLGAFDQVEVRDVVRFSLDLLPSVLETRRRAASQHYPVGGYAAIERHGTLDAILQSELALDPDLFLARLSEGELLYHGRERRHDEDRGEHHILIDGSASMHGLRQIFARGLAIALGKKLSLLGAEVRLRFFDGRLHEAIPLGTSLAAALPYLLSFRSSRGRNYGRVFTDLARELKGRGPRDGAGSVTLYLLTHGECHVPIATMAAVSHLAAVRGVFILPSGELDLAYLPLLQGYTVVTDEVLRQPERRRAQALGIVAEAASARSRRPSQPLDRG